MRERLSLELHGYAVQVTADDRYLEWLQEYHLPSYSFQRGSGASVTLVADFDRTSDLWQKMGSLEPTDALTRDGKFEQLPARLDPDGKVTLYDEGTGTLFRFGPGPDDPVRGWVSWKDAEHGRLAAGRILMEILGASAVRRGGLLLHASAVVANGVAHLLLGPRRSGKTTQLLKLLSTGQFRLLSNDRVFVSPDGMAFGVPTVVALRDGTLDVFSDLRSRIVSHGYFYKRTRAECLSSRSPIPAFELSLWQLAELFGTSVSGPAPLRSCLFVEYRPELGDEVQLQSVDAVAELHANILRSGASFSSPEAFALWSSPRSEDSLRNQCEEIARRAKLARLSVGPRASTGALLAALDGVLA